MLRQTHFKAHNFTFRLDFLKQIYINLTFFIISKIISFF